MQILNTYRLSVKTFVQLKFMIIKLLAGPFSLQQTSENMILKFS